MWQPTKAFLISLFDVGTLRRPAGPLGHVFTFFAAATMAVLIYANFVIYVQPWTMAALFMGAMYVLIFLLVPAGPRSDPERPTLADWILAAASFVVLAYFAIHATRLIERIPDLDDLTFWDTWIGLLFAALSVEVTRRTAGLGMTVLVVACLLYNFLGHLLTGVMGHNYIGTDAFLETNVYSVFGINGTVARVAATYAAIYVLFGVLLTHSGAGEFFYQLAASLTGRAAGGPAKVAVISSGLYGTVSGNSVADVVTTGSVTIPMMKRIGYSAPMAAGIETAASAGGSLMPPVMGAAAFVMVEYTDIPYGEIALAALMPALLYYLSVFMQVHFRAKRDGMGGMQASEIPSFLAALRQGWPHLASLAVLIGCLSLGYTAIYAAVLASATVVVVAAFRKSTRMGPVALYNALAEAIFRLVIITGTCAAAGLILGGLTMTGLAQKASFLIDLVSGDNLFVTLLMAAVITTILGLGLPTVSSYILAAVLVGPVMANLGIPVLVGHMFLLYYAVMSSISPPVAVAASAAASIADCNPNVAAGISMRLAFVAFVVPFGFVYAPELLLLGAPVDIVLNITSAAIGITLMAAAFEGFLFSHLTTWMRWLVAAAGLFLMVPIDNLLTLAGLAVAALVGGFWYASGRSRPPVQPA